MYRVIAFCGAKGAGKTIATNYLVSKGYMAIRFSEPLITGTKHLFNFSDEQMMNNTDRILCDNTPINPHKAVAFIGEDVFKYNIHHLIPGMNFAFWTKLGITRMLENPNERFVVNNVSTINEYYELKKYFPSTLIIKITDPLSNTIDRGEYVPYDLEITNTTGIFNKLDIIRD